MKLWTRIAVGALAVVFALGAVVLAPRPQPAHADSLWKELIDEAVRAVAKNLAGHPEWSDQDLKRNLDEEVNRTVTGIMQPDSEMTRAAIGAHCWRVYTLAWHPDLYSGDFYANGPVPGDYFPTDIYGYSSTWDQLNVCVRTGFVPASPYDEGSIDIQ